MTSLNGREEYAAFEGAELEPDAQALAVLELFAIQGSVEDGALTEDGYRRGVEALRTLGAGVDGPPSFGAALRDLDRRGAPARAELLRALEMARPLRACKWGSADHPPRRWVVRDVLPAGRVALLTGEGGVGKSRLALQLAAGVASGGDEGVWIGGAAGSLTLGDAVGAGSAVVFASWEDEPEEFERRLHELSGCGAPWVSPDALAKLTVVDMVGEGPLWGPLPGRHIATVAGLTVLGERLRRLCEAEDARLLVVDPLAAAYAADENARGLVRAFVSDWDAWGRAQDCAVLILAHPPKTPGVSYAGSTDWHGAARALWNLQPDGSGGSTLEFVKGNYGAGKPALSLAWDAEDGTLRWKVLGPAVSPSSRRYQVDD